MLAEGPTFGIDGVLSSPEKNFSVNFSKASTNVSVCISMLIIVICLLMEKKYLSLKLTMKTLNFQFNVVSEVHLMDSVLLSLEKSGLPSFPRAKEISVSALEKKNPMF